MDTEEEASKIDEILCDSGESSMFIEVGNPLASLRLLGERMLDSAYLNGVTVVRVGEKFYVGEFAYVLQEVGEKEAHHIAKSFGTDDEEED